MGTHSVPDPYEPGALPSLLSLREGSESKGNGIDKGHYHSQEMPSDASEDLPICAGAWGSGVGYSPAGRTDCITAGSRRIYWDSHPTDHESK